MPSHTLNRTSTVPSARLRASVKERSATHELHRKAPRKPNVDPAKHTSWRQLTPAFREPAPTASGVRSLDRTSDTFAFLAVIEGAVLTVIRTWCDGEP